jgi:hypothetical protein
MACIEWHSAPVLIIPEDEIEAVRHYVILMIAQAEERAGALERPISSRV